MIGSPGIGNNNEASINQTHNFNENYKCDEDPDQVVC